MQDYDSIVAQKWWCYYYCIQDNENNMSHKVMATIRLHTGDDWKLHASGDWKLHTSGDWKSHASNDWKSHANGDWKLYASDNWRTRALCLEAMNAVDARMLRYMYVYTSVKAL